MTQSKKKLIFEILELDASRYLKYSLLGSWWGGGVERGKHVFLTIFQSFPCPGDKLLKAGHGQQKGIWGSLSSLAKSERIARALPGVSKNSSLAICFSSSFSTSLLPSLSLLFSFSLLVLPSPECPSHCPDSSSQRLTWRPSMPRGRLIFLQPSPGLGYLGLECPFCQ